MYGTLKKIIAFAGSKEGLLKKSLLFAFLSGLFAALQFAALFIVVEALVQKAISTLTVGKTLIVIAHRLSTIVGADNIVVVKDGTIHAQGTHEKLLETCPLYRDMWQAHIGAKDQM